MHSEGVEEFVSEESRLCIPEARAQRAQEAHSKSTAGGRMKFAKLRDTTSAQLPRSGGCLPFGMSLNSVQFPTFNLRCGNWGGAASYSHFLALASGAMVKRKRNYAGAFGSC